MSSACAHLSSLRHACRYVRNRAFPRASYADDGEDRALGYLLDGVRSFVDVGANDGISSSNTTLAAVHGGRGLCFEPNPAVFVKLKWFYSLTRRVECVREGLSNVAGSLDLRCDGLLSAMPITEDKGLSELLEEFRQGDPSTVRVPVSRLSDWFLRRPDLLGCDLISIDVEGHELNVLRGIDWSLHAKPGRAFVIETHAMSDGRRVWRHRDYDEIDFLLKERGYLKTAASRNNTIWLHREEWNGVRLAKTRGVFPAYVWFD